MSENKSKQIGAYVRFPQEVHAIRLQLPELEYPITCTQDFVNKLGGTEKVYEFHGKKLKAGIMAMFIPSYYYPILSEDNLAEKLGELIGQGPMRKFLRYRIKVLPILAMAIGAIVFGVVSLWLPGQNLGVKIASAAFFGVGSLSLLVDRIRECARR